jgi:cob(I)alamin adenosyltransferase
MSKLYTTKGDDGTTGLLGEGRYAKSALRFEVLGTLDELSATLGLARSLTRCDVNMEIEHIQVVIYEMMAEIASTKENEARFKKITAEYTLNLENKIAEFSTKIQVPNQFILPGGSTASAVVSMARTISRRAERRLVELMAIEILSNTNLIPYMNRLSSFLYTLELFLSQSSEGEGLTFAKGSDR